MMQLVPKPAPPERAKAKGAAPCPQCGETAHLSPIATGAVSARTGDPLLICLNHPKPVPQWPHRDAVPFRIRRTGTARPPCPATAARIAAAASAPPEASPTSQVQHHAAPGDLRSLTPSTSDLSPDA